MEGRLTSISPSLGCGYLVSFRKPIKLGDLASSMSAERDEEEQIAALVALRKICSSQETLHDERLHKYEHFIALAEDSIQDD